MQARPGRDVETSVREWIAAWGLEVASVDMTAARSRFADDVVAFGSFAEVVHGIDELQAKQWAIVWPAISGFSFRIDELIVIASDDGCQAVAVVPWDSVGKHADGSAVARPGRATVVLRRESPADPWLGVHTHFSLVPDAR